MKTPVRVAVVGAGQFGRNHLRVLAALPNAKLVAVADEVAGNNPLGASILFGGGNVVLTASFGGAWGFTETVSITAPGHVAVQI